MEEPSALVGLASTWTSAAARRRLSKAFRRRARVGATGPDIRVDFFGGWDTELERTVVDLARTFVVEAGGELDPRPHGSKPVFVIRASGDAPVCVQIVKGWLDASGEGHRCVYDVVGQVWADPDFSPDQPAFYYGRVIVATDGGRAYTSPIWFSP